MPISVAVGVIRNAQGELLVALRPEGRPLAGLWEFPGGKIEPFETAEMALRRELHEEIGIHVEQASFLTEVTHCYDDHTSVMLSVWLVEKFSGTPHGCENQSLRWVTASELRQLPVPAANQLILQAIE